MPEEFSQLFQWTSSLLKIYQDQSMYVFKDMDNCSLVLVIGSYLWCSELTPRTVFRGHVQCQGFNVGQLCSRKVPCSLHCFSSLPPHTHMLSDMALVDSQTVPSTWHDILHISTFKLVLKNVFRPVVLIYSTKLKCVCERKINFKLLQKTQ